MLLEELNEVLSILRTDLEKLIQCLQEEKEALIQYDLKRLTKAYHSKYAQLQKIGAIEKRRKIIEDSLKQESSGEADLESNDEIQEKLSCIRSLAQAAQEFNEHQREFLMYSLQDVQSSLYLLEALQGNEKFQGYNQQGEIEGETVADHARAIDHNF